MGREIVSCLFTIKEHLSIQQCCLIFKYQNSCSYSQLLRNSGALTKKWFGNYAVHKESSD